MVNLLETSGFTYTINPSFTTEYLLRQKERSEVLGLLGEYRISESILERTLNSSFLEFLCFDGKIHPQFSQFGTKTMRYTSTFPNIQQVPSRGGYSNFLFAERIRSLFDTDDEHVFLKIDYGQIEYRLICHIAPGKAGEEVRKQYEKNPNLDFHAYTQEMTGLDRKTAKNMSFGISFGLGLDGMCEMYGWSKEKGKEIAEQYHSKMPFVQPAFDFVKQTQTQYKYIYTIGGAKARLESHGGVFYPRALPS